MHIRSKRLVGLVAVAAAAMMVAACSGTKSNDNQADKKTFSPGFAECLSKPNECNSGERKAGGTITMAVEQDMASWHINAAEGTHFWSSQMLTGLIPGPFTAWPDLSYHLNPDLMVSADITSQTPFTLTYKIQQNAIWSDGTPISGDDFAYNLYTFDGKTCKECTPATTTGYDLITDLKTTDNGKTVTVTFSDPFPDWKGLFSLYPAHIAKQNGWTGDKSDAAGLAKSFTAFINTQPT